ncbi:hypothetical protein [Bogoriella caseilytica]|uniref:Uncharacterized protein n=1 Tax=Bogoriella caseilytica TaxID=56055 RepID=A0A3N2BB38_9MICO|nr:hypothetical protein [Bogoriella caseilytica]ROR72294.1 hypothetical protein EDD31_0645 [Bogoriella caseilytica]
MNPRLSAQGASRRHRIAAGLLAICLGLVLASPAAGAARVSVESELGGAQVHADQATTVRVSGAGFQSVPGGFGGIYVLFGSISGDSWRPSQGGQTGRDYLYAPDAEARDNQGYQRFVAFPGSSTDQAANGGVLAEDGSWSLSMVVPGARFTARDRDGAPVDVDCTQVQCGFLTVGAHGVASAANETFTPVSFAGAPSSTATSSGAGQTGTEAGGQTGTAAQPGAAGEGAAEPGTDDQPAGSGAESAPASPDEGAEDEDTEAPAISGPATVGLERSTIQAGRVLSFTGRGFAVGEQVVASLGAGLAGVGPILAGDFGEVAGAVQIPADIRPGTHLLRLEGAGSGQIAEVEISVAADPAAFAPADQPSSGWDWVFIVALLTGALLVALLVTSLVDAIRRRRRARRPDAAAAPEPAPPPPDPATRPEPVLGGAR